MSNTVLKTRIKHKYDTPTNWSKATNFVPLEGELCIYNNGTGTAPQIKVGDGTTLVSDLPFIKAGSDTTVAAALTSGTKVGTITIDGTATTLYAPSYSAATTSTAGLMSASDKSKLDGITASADAVSFSRSLTSGTKIGTLTINGTATDLYCQTNTDTNTTYSAGTGLSLSGTTFSNAGVRSIATGSSNGTISVNTNGTTADVAVKGLGTAAYTASTAYLAASGTAAAATKLATARTITLGGQFQGSASFDGTTNITIDGALKYCSLNGNGTANYPYHRIAYATPGTATYTDSYAHFLITANYQGGAWGIIKVAHRTNESGAAVTGEATWLIRSSNMPENAVTIATYGVSVTNSVYFDVFFNVNGSSWPRITITPLGPCNLTLVNSNEASSTSVTECYATVAAAGTALHGQAYTNIYTSTQNAIYGAVWN